jgi:hypothetical protein
MKKDHQQSINPKMRGRKLRICVNWHGALKQKGVKQKGVKQGLGVLAALILSFTQTPTGPKQN